MRVADEFAKTHPAQQHAFLLGVLATYSDVFAAVAQGFDDPAGLTKTYADLIRQHETVIALINVEGVLDVTD